MVNKKKTAKKSRVVKPKTAPVLATKEDILKAAKTLGLLQRNNYLKTRELSISEREFQVL